MLNLQIQNHKPLREMVYDSLKMQILTGKIVPGTRMMEIELAEEMGVSRTPIREAIRKLEKEGLVTIEPRRGAYASTITTSDIIDILEVRQDLEGLAGSFAAKSMDEDELAELVEVSRLYNDAVKEGNVADMIEYDTRFHKVIVDSCENKILVNMIEQLQEMVLRFRYIYYDDFRRASKMPAEHECIVAAIKTRDGAAARSGIDKHLESLKQIIQEDGVEQKK